MKERTLSDRFDELEDRVMSVEALTRYRTANELRFYIFDYNPKDEITVRQEIQKLIMLNPKIIEFDLYDMIVQIVEEEGYMDDIVRMENDYDKALLLREIFQPLLAVEEENSRFIEIFKEKAPDDGKHIVLISGVGKSYPIVRSHTILNNLQSVFRRNPVVMMYPGRYMTKNAMTLRLFERLDDDNYYRAFSLVERRIGNDY